MKSFTAINIVPLKGIIRLIGFVLLIRLFFIACDKSDDGFYEDSYNGITIKKEVDNIPYHQSFAVYGDYICLFDANAHCFIYNNKDRKIVGQMTLDTYGFSSPHANTACFGGKNNIKSEFPLLYVSQWNGEGGCLVYEIIRERDGSFNILLKQTIFTYNLPKEKYGTQLGDWIVDAEHSLIYAMKYKINTSLEEKNNCIQICCFKLPLLSDGNIVEFNENDVVDVFSVPFIRAMQDKQIKNNILYVLSGYNNLQKISMIDLESKRIYNSVDLSHWGGEPEGLDVTYQTLISYDGIPNIYKLTYD